MRNRGTSHLPWIKATLLVLLLVALGAIAWHKTPPEWFDPEWIKAFLQRMGPLAPLAFILLRTIGIVATVVPNAPLDIAAGVIFGPFLGTVYSLLGSEAGAIVCFLLARGLGREAITRLLRRDVTFSDRIAQRHLPYIVLFARLEPIFSFALVSYGAGLTRMSLRAFALSTLVGMTPGTILLNYYGKSLFTGNLVLQLGLGLVLVVLLIVVPVWIRRKNPWGWYDRMTGGRPKGK
ncbi:MAG: TVP38/TMEM64 family protein [Deltaproteobacteria bacterium]|nr:TVP38/TMEM64 family protein [Deltaproteobacteria bacterium]